MQKKLTKEEITEIINLAYDATEASKTGKIVVKFEENGMPIVSQMAYSTFQYVLNSICPKNIGGIDEPGEDWKK